MTFLRALTLICAVFAFSEAFPGGTIVEDGEIPYQAFIKIEYDDTGSSNICTGSLIKPNVVLTAASCVQNFRLGYVIVGTSNIQDVSSSQTADVIVIDRVVVHEAFLPNTLTNNVALVFLNRDARMKKGFVETINYTILNEDIFVGTNVAVSGWGPNQNFLNRAYIPVISQISCFIRYDNLLPSNICAGKIDVAGPCMFDEGAPMVGVINNDEKILLGVFSHKKLECTSGMPGVYSRLSSYAKWIERNL